MSEKTWYDPRVPAPDVCVTRYLIDRFAESQPEKEFAVFTESDEVWTYGSMKAEVARYGAGLQQLGVKQGDHVVSWLPSGPDSLRCFFGANYIGAVFVPINLAYRGNILSHALDVADAEIMIAHADLVPRLADIDRRRLKRVVVIGGEAEPIDGLELIHADALAPENAELQPLERQIQPWDSQAIIFTSGTTGPSKGVLCSYLHIYTNATSTTPTVTPEDRYMVNLPMFHVGGVGLSFGMLAHGASIAMNESFRTDTFWDEIRRTGSTIVFLLGAMANFIEKAPASDKDRDHPLKVAYMVPLDGDIEAFSKRFGIDVYTIFNMTEISTPIHSQANPTQRGVAGVPRDGVEVRLVDPNDCEVAPGEIGEMLVRTDRPWGMNSGYYRNPEATARAWRNGWFHTGDAFKQDEKGNFYFVDRMKDAIRRRGENISSFEVESEVNAFPTVQEAAVIPVPSEHGEDEVMACVALKPDAGDFDPAELIEFLKPRMAHFMIPRYVEVLDELPKTPTAKVQKHLLRERGVTNATWDREAHGIVIKREKIGA
jgi:crotonobetaine/carnitine-CoA ligase